MRKIIFIVCFLMSLTSLAEERFLEFPGPWMTVFPQELYDVSGFYSFWSPFSEEYDLEVEPEAEEGVYTYKIAGDELSHQVINCFVVSSAPWNEGNVVLKNRYDNMFSDLEAYVLTPSSFRGQSGKAVFVHLEKGSEADQVFAEQLVLSNEEKSPLKVLVRYDGDKKSIEDRTALMYESHEDGMNCSQ